jgi:hypothetical protein
LKRIVQWLLLPITNILWLLLFLYPLLYPSIRRLLWLLMRNYIFDIQAIKPEFLQQLNLPPLHIHRLFAKSGCGTTLTPHHFLSQAPHSLAHIEQTSLKAKMSWCRWKTSKQIPLQVQTRLGCTCCLLSASASPGGWFLQVTQTPQRSKETPNMPGATR